MQTELLVKAAKVFLNETKKQHLYLNLGESTYVLKEVTRLEQAFASDSLSFDAIRALLSETTRLGEDVTRMLNSYSDCLKA